MMNDVLEIELLDNDNKPIEIDIDFEGEFVSGSDGEDYKRGYNEGHEKGYTDGEKVGYKNGYSQGLIDGEKEEYDTFWDAYQQNNTRSNYANAFYGRGWTDVTFKPKYDIRVTTGNAMFSGAYITDLENILSQQGVVLDLSQSTNVSSIFAYCPNLTRIPPLDFSKVERNGGGNLFRDCRQLVSVEINNVPEHTYHASYNIWNLSFNSCNALKDFKITGVISNSISFANSSLLTMESVNNIINALGTYDDGNSRTVKFHSNVLANITDEQHTAIISKNWIYE